MKKSQALRLMDESLGKEFNVNNFARLVKELFNKIDIKIGSNFVPAIRKEFYDYVKSYDLIGEYIDKEDNKIGILTVELKKSSSIDRARVMQRNFIAKYLKKYGFDSALVAFYDKESVDWRFSFVKMEYDLVKGKDILTPARRYSFLVGLNEYSHTVQSQLLDLLIKESLPLISDFEEVFSVERVTKKFFDEYKDLFLDIKEAIDKLLRTDDKIKEEFDSKGIVSEDFAKRLLGQIVFLYFLQKKGWLGVDKSSKVWDGGPKNFLQGLYSQAVSEEKNFFNDFLQPLFYDALANPREGDDGYYKLFDCRIPFLNGGLFEPLNDYDWKNTEILLDNHLFKDVFDVFKKYNFTVREDEPLEREVAVDPEMLGKVFENLLDVKDRKSKGAFYTPREIVHYMCQQSIINYLETNTDITRDDIESLVRFGEFALSYLVREKVSNDKTAKNFSLPESIKDNYLKIDKLLSDVKVVDPACGSGAFLVGMMNEIIKIRNVLSEKFSKSVQIERSSYNLKRETIENCLYGVDIDFSAVDITKLRFWLSLIVDEDSMSNIKPLPNLDHKIMCGNSLIDEFEGVKLFDKKLLSGGLSKGEQTKFNGDFDFKIKESKEKLSQLRVLQKDFFKEPDRKKKRALKNQIDKLEWDFIESTLKEKDDFEAIKKLQEYKKSKSKPFFVWELYFSDVFQRENPGFDMVIANPPYVDSELMVKETPQLRNKYAEIYDSAKGNWDLFIIFIEKGIHILRKKGTICYIVPNKLISARYSEALRRILIQKDIKEVRDYSTVDVFKSVDVYPITFLLKNDSPSSNVTMTLMDSIEKIKNTNEIQRDLFYEDIYWSRYFVENELSLKILIKLKEFNKVINFFPNISGAATVNEAYKIKEILEEFNENSKDYKKFINTGTIDPYISLWGYKKTTYIKERYKKPIISNLKLKNFRLNRFKQANSPKIIIGGMTKELECYYDIGNYLAGKSTTIILPGKLDIKYLVGILNSKLISFWYKTFFKSLSLAGGYLRIGPNEIAKIPIVKPLKELENKTKKLVDEILFITKDNDYLSNPKKQAKVKKLQKEINELVYKLYELTPEEIKIVEEATSDSK